MNFQGQNPSIFLRSGPLVYKRGRGQPPQRLMGKNCLFGQNNGISHVPSKLVDPPNYSERKYQMEQGLRLLVHSQTLLYFYQLLLSPHPSV